jgi:predicted nucleic acid-binding protein
MMVVLDDHDVAEVTGWLEARMSEAGIGVEDLIAAATAPRAEITREEFGREDGR